MNATKSQNQKKISPRERYFSGQISADEYLEKLQRSREGDQVRRSIEEKAKKISARLSKLQ